MGKWKFEWRTLSGRMALPVLALSALGAHAQSAPDATSPKLTYRSAWTQYRGFTQESVAPWQQTNDVVKNAGGWRAYAKEARQPEVVGKGEPDPSTGKTPSEGKP